jgi:hypothetical protein
MSFTSVLCGLCLAVTTTAACASTSGEAQPAPPGQGGGAACTLSRSGHATGDEWGSCVQVTTTLSRPPRVGEEARLAVEVLAVSERTVRVEVDLPRGFVWVTVPAGFEQARLADRSPENGGCLHRASGSMTLAAGKISRLTGTVKATARGFATLRARAVSTEAADMPGGTGDDSVFVTVRRAPEPSFFGYYAGNEAWSAGAAEPLPTGCDVSS